MESNHQLAALNCSFYLMDSKLNETLGLKFILELIDDLILTIYLAGLLI